MSNLKLLQRLVLDLYDNVGEPISVRQPYHNAFAGRPEVSARDAASTGERLRSQMTGIGILQRGTIFSTFHKQHTEEALKVLQLLTKQNDRDLNLVLAYLRDHVNEELFIYASSIFLSHNEKLRGLRLPPIEEVFPEKFIPLEIISRARMMQRRSTQETQPIVIDADFTGNDLDPEHRLAYWREDIGLNAHHWHWHIVYPFIWTPELGSIKDRKGELFYYMHQQMIARYDAERLSNNFSRVTTLHDWKEPINEGYAPHLTKELSGIVYSFRPANMKLQDLPSVTLDQLQTWQSRILQAIHSGYVVKPDGTKVPLDEVKGIDLLGDIIEAGAISINPTFYGDYHNLGHDAISRIHDPDERYKQEIGVMGDSATAMRDPVFYRWHKYIDSMFQEHKKLLKPYTKEEVTFKDIIVESVNVKGTISQRSNYLRTFWQERTLQLQRGVAFNGPNPVAVRFRHLQHENFSYEIKVENHTKKAIQGTVRIFMGPKFSETRQPLTPNEQRPLLMEMDKFEVEIAAGKNTIRRKSDQSSVTVNQLENFGQLIADAESNEPTEAESYCSCGLPNHLLIPRGKPEGMEFQIFVIVTNSLLDRVNGENVNQCQSATSYCGILNKKYPDKRAMGFPFDRRIESSKWSDFFSNNMNFVEISIYFTNKVVNVDAGNIVFPE